jgi:hypothetical protein
MVEDDTFIPQNGRVRSFTSTHRASTKGLSDLSTGSARRGEDNPCEQRALVSSSPLLPVIWAGQHSTGGFVRRWHVVWAPLTIT